MKVKGYIAGILLFSFCILIPVSVKAAVSEGAVTGRGVLGDTAEANEFQDDKDEDKETGSIESEAPATGDTMKKWKILMFLTAACVVGVTGQRLLRSKKIETNTPKIFM